MRAEGSTPRRSPVKGHPGVYRSVSGRYEITYLDSNGRRRWQTVRDGGLREADAALVSVKNKLNNGERVAPEGTTFEQYAEAMLADGGKLKPQTIALYRSYLKNHVYPVFGTRRIQSVNEDHVLAVIADMHRKGYSDHTILGVLTPISRVLRRAARRGVIPVNPMTRLERGERPRQPKSDPRVLGDDEIAALLKSAGVRYQAIIATGLFGGMRFAELLGLTWADVDFDADRLRVRYQLSRGKPPERVPLKTDGSRRDVVMFPTLARMLREHKMRSRFKQPTDYVFASERGGPWHQRNVSRRGLDKVAAKAGIIGEPKLTMHDLRHTFASMLIAQGHDVVFVSRMLGHSKVKTTLDTYAHLFAAHASAQKMVDGMEARFGAALKGVG